MGKSKRPMYGFNDGDTIEKNSDNKNYRRHAKNVLRNYRNVELDVIDEDEEFDIPDVEDIAENHIIKKDYKINTTNKFVDIRANKIIKDPDELKKLLS